MEGLLSRTAIGTDDLLNNYAGDFRGFVDALRSGQLYVNVHTADHAAGAIRGQIGGLPGGTVRADPEPGSGRRAQASETRGTPHLKWGGVL